MNMIDDVSSARPLPAAAGPASATGRAGFSLVEVLMAVVILGIILVALAGMTFVTAQRSHMLAEQNAIQGVMLQEMNRLYVSPWDEMKDECDKLGSGNYVFERCIRVADVGASVRQITIVMTSPRYPKQPDSVTFVRARPLGQ